MAWFFQLSIECGEDVSTAREVKSRLRQFCDAESSGVNTTYSIGIRPYDNAYWCLCVPHAAGKSGVVDAKEAALVTELASGLYEFLRQMQGYRYAIVGHETEFFRTITELMEEEPSIIRKLKGLVVSRTIWTELGSPGMFEPFSGGYLWIPYKYQS